MMTIETTFLGNSKLAGQVAHSNSAAFDKENEKRVPRLCFVESPPEEADLTEDPITRHFDVTDDEPVDMFSEFYQPYDLTVLESLYPHGMQKSCRYVKSTFFSPPFFIPNNQLASIFHIFSSVRAWSQAQRQPLPQESNALFLLSGISCRRMRITTVLLW